MYRALVIGFPVIHKARLHDQAKTEKDNERGVKAIVLEGSRFTGIFSECTVDVKNLDHPFFERGPPKAGTAKARRRPQYVGGDTFEPGVPPVPDCLEEPSFEGDPI